MKKITNLFTNCKIDNIEILWNKLWPHQKKAIEFIGNEKECLLNLWCSTGKSNIIIYKILIDK